MHTLPTYEQAYNDALEVVEQVCCTQRVTLDSALGRILANAIKADRNLPPYNRSQMDGYAVVANEVHEGVTMRVVGEVAAGSTFVNKCEPETCVAIATGAPVPDCFDAVVQHELTDGDTSNVTFHCDTIAQGKAIHLQGSDAKEGDVLVPKHTKMTPQHIGIAASAGACEPEVVSKPNVIVLTSGDEVVEPSKQPLPYQIRNGNASMLCSAFDSMGCTVTQADHLFDDAEATNRAVAQALQGEYDLVVTVGGISAGKRDFFPDAFINFGVDLVVKGARIQPGKPIIVGKHADAVVLGLPGNPVSALVCCCIFGWPIVRKLQGVSDPLPWQKAPLATNVTPNPHRLFFRPCQLTDGKVTVPDWQGSGDIVHTATTHGIVQLPSSKKVLSAGDIVSYLSFPW